MVMGKFSGHSTANEVYRISLLSEDDPLSYQPVMIVRVFRVLYLGHNGKQDWHGVRHCPHTGGVELVSVEQADRFDSKAAAEALRQQYERMVGGSRTVLREAKE